ncbi:hypothetical protein SAMN05216581_1842 [Pseudomonas asplenii]|uniref:Uncharacterized protein n=1 Tax=Pseudomonas asplenii TaxID=53407 RepID=A0A1H6NBS0_9PSED|nr:hypothetical protein SAMN05216581_1842 [Pseudomonas fuscovaginae]
MDLRPALQITLVGDHIPQVIAHQVIPVGSRLRQPGTTWRSAAIWGISARRM